MATPQIPPRPVRTTHLPPASANMDIPRIPPRPKRTVERSVSPHRDTFARSPLNDPSFLHNGRRSSKENLAPESIRRPPSVNLPSVGQEGMEYDNLSSYDDASPPEQTKNVAGDLPLHQPKASFPASTAKSRIQNVTRTDSSQAAAAGIGKLLAESDKGGNASSAQSDTSGGTRSRPQSIYKDGEEHGIPEIGLQVPMYPNAGDVQAPTPSPYPAVPSTGIGYFNNVGQSAPNHVRTKSGRQVFNGPPGSYGLHGHGVIAGNQFEKTWYEKHPEDAAREKQGEYGPAIQDNRKEWHLSRDDLNKMVHDTTPRGAGLGTSPATFGTPDEEIGYRATEEFASRMASPKPSSRPASIIVAAPSKERSSSSQTHAESPLRNMVFPINQGPGSEHAVELEGEHDDIIHIDPPSQSGVKSQTSDLPTRGRSVHGSIGDEDPGYSTPILAADEVAKRPPQDHLQPAVSPELERRASGGEYSDIPSQRRSNSRSNSLHNLSRVSSAEDYDRRATPLDNVEEYEPLFPDESDEEKKKKQPKAVADKVKRPDLARHHFPSQDVWEDTPSSHQLETTVETPDLPENEQKEEVEPVKAPETKEPEAPNKVAVTDDSKSFLPDKDNRAKSNLPAHILKETPVRPGMSQRFPSQDIWEDAPEHVYQYTTVDTPEPEEPASATEEKHPEIPSKPNIPARPQRTKPASAETSSPIDKKAPSIPERPKPQVPARPTARPVKRESSEDVPLTKTVSGGESPAVPKTKPVVPARPGGSKIAALKAGFMNDLNLKLGLGPQQPKIKEPEEEAAPKVEEKAPLADARKGRAKGPQRRKPTASPSPAAAVSQSKPAAVTLSFAPTVTIFSISNDGVLSGPVRREEPIKQAEVPAPAAADPVPSAPAAEPEVKPEPIPEVKPETLPESKPVAKPDVKPEADLATEAPVSEKQVPAKEDDEAPKSTDLTESSIQTSKLDPKVTSPEEKIDEAPTSIDGKASEEDNIVVDKKGVEDTSGPTLTKPAKEEGEESKTGPTEA